MKINNRLMKIAILALIVGLAGLGLNAIKRGSTHSTAAVEIRPAAETSIVATVEGRQITAKVYRMYLKNGVEGLGLSDKTAEGRSKIELLKEGIIEELIDRAIVEIEAERRGLSVPQTAFEQEYKKRVAQMGGDELYGAYLSEHALSDEEFRQIMRGELYGPLLQQELTRDVTVSAEEARRFYDKEKANPTLAAMFVEPERVRASHILIGARRSQIEGQFRSEGISDKARLDRLVHDEIDRRRERARSVLARARAGQDFAELARQHSDDPGTRMRGGDLGLFTRNAHTAKFDEAAFALKPGKTSDIVETEYGFHIIKVAEHTPERTKSFEQARPSVEQHLLARKRAERLTRWLEGQRKKARVSVEPFYQVGHFKQSDVNQQ
jgi:parvulin-like peptidyl-prolyl isomerase